LFLLAVGTAAFAQPDVAAIRRDIERNGWSFEVDDTFSSQLTPEQRINLRGFNPPPDYQKVLDSKLKIFPITRDLPTNLDWRELDGITPVKNQAECGSCWAFAATAEMEAYVKIYYGVETDLSEQQVISCNPYGSGCDGGWAGAAYNVFYQNGAVMENCMPYLGMDPPEAPCEQNSFRKYGYVTDWHSVSNNVEQIKAALQYGPLCTSVDAGDAFEAYSSGCYDVPGGWTNHLVLIVGYDDRSCGGNGAWIIKNSWGPGFGEGGYITIQYGAGSVGINLTQLEYTPPPTSIEINPAITSEPLMADSDVAINWETSGAAVSTVNIFFGAEGHCHDFLVAGNVPNTGSYTWTVPNTGTSYGSLVVFPSSGTENGFGLTEDYVRIIGHKTRYVSPAGSDTPPYETPATAAHNINDAVAACTGTDSVLVAGGNYVGTVSVGTTVRLFGGYSADFSQRDLDLFPTRIQSGSTGMRFQAGSGEFGMADGFVFSGCTGGNTSEPEAGRHGGAMYVMDSSPTISHCRFEDNNAAPGTATGFGGAVCVVGGSPTFSECVFTGNTASKGGALAAFAGASVSLVDCLVKANSCSDSLSTYYGAGVFVDGASLHADGGSIINNGGSGNGGGICLLNSTAELAGIEILGNRAIGNGGGILADDSQLTMRNMAVLGNSSLSGSGGGIAGDNPTLDLRNVRLDGNSCVQMGGGLYVSGMNGRIENCLASGNSAGTGGGMVAFSGGPSVVRNNIAMENSGGGMLVVGADMDYGFNDVWQNTGGDYVSMTPPESDFSLDPLFTDAESGDFGLAQFSPCVDRGQDDPACLDPDGSRADVGFQGGPEAEFTAPARIMGAALQDMGGGTWRLTWDAAADPDISHYVVYRDTAEVFVPTPLKALATVDHPTTVYEDSPGMNCYYLVVAVDTAGHSGGYSERMSTGSAPSPAGQNELPRTLAIAGVVPNPFNPRTTVRYDVPRSGQVDLVIYDLKGRKVKQLVSGQVESGRHEVVWDGRDSHGRMAAAGVYFARMSDGQSVTTAKMVLAK